MRSIRDLNRPLVTCGATLILVLGVSLGALAKQEVPKVDYGPVALESYELREVLLDPPDREPREDGTVLLHRFGYQLVIHADYFPSRALDPWVYLDDILIYRFQPCEQSCTNCMVYTFYDPKVLRSEHRVQLIYGDDERTRSRMAAPFDPERLERLPEAVRRANGLPELEFLTIEPVKAGEHRLTAIYRFDSPTSVRWAFRLADGSWQLGPQRSLEERGRLDLDLPAGTKEVAALRPPEPSSEALKLTDLRLLPKGWEIIDHKPVGK